MLDLRTVRPMHSPVFAHGVAEEHGRYREVERSMMALRYAREE